MMRTRLTLETYKNIVCSTAGLLSFRRCKNASVVAKSNTHLIPRHRNGFRLAVSFGNGRIRLLMALDRSRTFFGGQLCWNSWAFDHSWNAEKQKWTLPARRRWRLFLCVQPLGRVGFNLDGLNESAGMGQARGDCLRHSPTLLVVLISILFSFIKECQFRRRVSARQSLDGEGDSRYLLWLSERVVKKGLRLARRLGCKPFAEGECR